MSGPVDQAVREQALDATQSFIVQAPAGSGKTELLTRRVLTLLCTVDEPEEILAITFTRKAASEMRQRVVEILERAGSDYETNDPYELEGIALAQQVLERDQLCGWNLLRNPQRLNLRTIDALATQLAHRLPVTSTLGAPTGLVENADNLYSEAAERFIESHLDELDLVLLHLGNKLDRARSLMAGLLARRDQWQRHVYAAGNDHDELRQVLEGMLAELVESRLANLCSLVPDGLAEKLLPCLNTAFEFSLHQAEGDIDELAWELQLWQDMLELPDCNISDLDGWTSVAFGLLTTSHGVRRRVTKNEGFPAKGDAKKLGVEPGMLEMHKQRMADVLEYVGQSSEFIEALVEVRKLPPPFYKDEQWALLSQLLELLPALLFELQLVFSERAQVDFGEISARAARALGTEDEPTDLALSMDLKLKHLLVDEFQDTSQTQFRLFTQLVSQWGQEDGRTFFAVGDPMQSIYRFREGDVALFTQVQRDGIGPVDVVPLVLSVNFRAAPALTQWVNASFAEIFPKRADADIGAVPYSPSEAFRNYDGRVVVHPLIDVDKQAEAEHVAKLCSEAIDGAPDHTVAILVRSRAQAVEIFTALRAHDLAYESVEMDLVGERAVVRDLISLTLALRYPHDRLHWLSLLRAPFVGLTLHDLQGLMNEAGSGAAVIERLQDAALLQTLSEDGQLRIDRMLKVIEPAMKRTLRGRLMPWVESVWLQLGGPVVCESDLDFDAADRAMALLYKLEAAGELWQKSTIEAAMAKLYAKPANASSCQIQVMTLHKSKGLEFDTVILPALNRPPRGDSSQLLNWFESTLDGQPRLLLAPFEQTGLHANQRDRINKLVQRASDRCNAQEKLRLLYVACTRAKRQLHLVARAAHNSKGELGKPVEASLLTPLWPLLETQFLAMSKAIDVEGKNADSTQVPSGESSSEQQHDGVPGVQAMLDLGDDTDHTPLDAPQFKRLPVSASMPQFTPFAWSARPEPLVPKENATIEFQWAGRDARDIGTVIHDQLQMLASMPAATPMVVNDEHRVVVRRQLRNLGLNVSRLDSAVDKVMKALANTLDDERGRWILQAHEQARSEWALSVPQSSANNAASHTGTFTPVQKIIIDRTFIDSDGVRWIVDYKTGDHEGGNLEAFLDKEKKRYADQLNGYAAIMKRLESRPVRVGLYFPMLREWREWEPDKI